MSEVKISQEKQWSVGASKSQLLQSLSKSKTAQLKKNVSGFDIGQAKAVGSFFSGLRAADRGEKTNFYDCKQMTGQEFVERLVKQQEDRY